MDNNNPPDSRKHFHSKSNMGERNRKRRRQNSTHEHNVATTKAMNTVYRILCPGKKIGGVLGKGGAIINALRDETHAKIRVADTIPGADERVVIIFSSPSKKNGISNMNQEPEHEDSIKKDDEHMEPHCPAQDALLRVHERIIAEEDQNGNPIHDTNELEHVVMARLLVPSVQVGCLLGKGGNIIQELRNDTGANIRILPSHFLPHGDMGTDELVQISGLPSVVKKALYQVSTLLHKCPRKEGPSQYSNPLPLGQHGFNPSQMPSRGNHMWPPQNPGDRGPWIGGYRSETPRFAPGGLNSGSGRETPEEFSMKFLCSSERIGVIGSAGGIIEQIQQETGAKIHVDAVGLDADEHVISVSSVEVLRDPRSPTIEAAIQLQSKLSDISDGIITTKILVPSSKVGCLLGQGGHIITEMRWRTQADIRVYSKSDKPKFALTNEELVQISGQMGVAKEALLEIASRLRERSLRGINSAVNPAYEGSFDRFPSVVGIPGRGPPPSGMIGPWVPGGYDHSRGGRYQNGGRGYPTESATTGYPGNVSMEAKIPNSAVPSVGISGSIPGIRQVSGATVKLQDPLLGSSECVVQIHGSSEQVKAAQSFLQAFAAPGGAPHYPLAPLQQPY